ncbi:MAG: hypothetical protein K8R90_10975 [Candidatus Cloacimonetes bacterium]|nr:hypothetical protein [Candidatus Cloacimonadota bacterium]
MKRMIWLAPLALALLLLGCDGFGLFGKVTDEQLYGDLLTAKLTISDKGPENDAKFIMYEVFNLAQKWPEAERITLQITIISKSKEELDFGRHSWSDISEIRGYENKLEFIDKEKNLLLRIRRKLRKFLK